MEQTWQSSKVRVGLHQGSALCPFLFNAVFNVLIEGVRDTMYPHDMVLVDESKEDTTQSGKMANGAAEQRDENEQNKD